MSKFHNTDDGPKPCTARKRPCPVGGEHFTDRGEAQKAFEAAHNAVPAPAERRLPRYVVPVKVIPFAGGRYYGCSVSKTRVTEHIQAMKEILGAGMNSLYEGNKVTRDRGHHYHLTVVSPPELSSIKKEGRELTAFPEQSDITFEGLGRANDGENDAFYVVCSSASLDKWRQENGLPKKDFHITLGFNRKDVHTMGKGENTILQR